MASDRRLDNWKQWFAQRGESDGAVASVIQQIYIYRCGPNQKINTQIIDEAVGHPIKEFRRSWSPGMRKSMHATDRR